MDDYDGSDFCDGKCPPDDILGSRKGREDYILNGRRISIITSRFFCRKCGKEYPGDEEDETVAKERAHREYQKQTGVDLRPRRVAVDDNTVTFRGIEMVWDRSLDGA